MKEFSQQDIIQLLEEIGTRSIEPIIIFLIGGCNMSLKGIKAITRDIDLVILTKKEYVYLKKTLITLGYTCHEENFSKNFYKMPITIFLKNDKRIDVFIRDVCNQIEVTKEMQMRAEDYQEFGKLKIKLVSNEDLFLFKSITDREKDVDDCRILIAGGLNWEIIKKELHQQEGKALWRFWVYEQLSRIENKYGKIIPKKISDYLLRLVKEKWSERPKDFMKEMKDEINS